MKTNGENCKTFSKYALQNLELKFNLWMEK